MLKRKKSAFILLSILSLSSVCRANEMEIFLKSSAYGTAAGAVLGLATLAVSEDPSAQRGNVARGASLGLYAGIGFGLYTLYGGGSLGGEDSHQVRYQAPEKPLESRSLFWLSALTHENKMDGAQVNWVLKIQSE